MYSELPPDIRNNHPYHMYDEIKLQPEAVARSLGTVTERGGEAVKVLRQARRLIITGCGTSFHAAQIGAWFFGALASGVPEIRSVQAYELVSYGPTLGSGDVVLGLSHSGTTFMTLRALERAERAGAGTILLTGFPETPGADVAQHVLPTGYPEERSWAHTASYLAALTSMAALANQMAEPAVQLDLNPLPEIVREALELEELAHRMAATLISNERYREPTPIVVVGAGPHAITAQECVLKLLETSYVPATAFELEQMLHGPLAAVAADTLLLIIAPPGHSSERAAELVRAAHCIDVVPVVLAGEENSGVFDDAHRLIMPDVPEELSPIPYVVPLQIFSYFLSVGKGYNPDLIHRDDERYRMAAKEYR
jgi:glutamine---fructose-6-phosphate transaminase (isomerizing)